MFGVAPGPEHVINTNVDNTGRDETGYHYRKPFGKTEHAVISKPVVYGNTGYLNSTRTIKNPGTAKADTTYTMPNGRQPNEPAVLDRFKQKFFKLDQARNVAEPTKRFQQGGPIQQDDQQKKQILVADFAVRYLKGMGVPEESIATPEGEINPEYIETLTEVLEKVDKPDFWKAFEADPDGVVAEYIQSTSPEAAQMAKKGAKLQRLSKLRKYLK